MPHSKERRKKAFTLIELAVVLVIVGLIAVLIFPAITDFIKFGKKTEAEDFLTRVKDKIIGFALMNKRLPTDLSEIGVGKDPYGNDIFYNPDPDLTSGDLCDETSTDLDVDRVDQGGATTTFDDIAFVVASFGRNTHQEFVGTETSATVTIYDPRYWPSAPGYGAGEYDEYDDMVDYVSLAYLRNKICTNVANQSFNPPGSHISFATDMGDFNQDNVVGTTGSLGQSIQVDYESGIIKLQSANGESDYGCLFYSGNLDGNCTDGLCNFGDGFRAYFKFTIALNSGGGWTFAVVGVNGTQGVNDGPITTLCGGDGGQYLGYASSGGSLGAVGLEPPKMAVEFDLYCTNLSDSYDVQGFGCTTGNDDEHLGIDYWREHGAVDFNDDVSHEALGAPGATDIRNPSPVLYAPYSGYNAGTMSDGVPKTIRVDVYRDAAGVAAGTNNTMELMAWYDCQNCTDLTLDYNGTNPPADYTAKFWNATDPFPLNNVFSHFRFGWTMGIGNNPQGVELSDFGLAFR